MNLNLGVLRRKTMVLSRVWSQPLCSVPGRPRKPCWQKVGGGARGRDSRRASPPSSGLARSRAPVLPPSPAPRSAAAQWLAPLQPPPPRRRPAPSPLPWPSSLSLLTLLGCFEAKSEFEASLGNNLSLSPSLPYDAGGEMNPSLIQGP